MPESNLLKLPKNIDPVNAVFVEPVSVALHGLNRLGLQPGEDLVVIGAGVIGQLTIMCARIHGAKNIFVFDIDDNKLEYAKRIGANYCYNTSKDGFFESYLEDTGGIGVLQVMEIVGVEKTILLAIDVCKPHGRISLVGSLGRPATLTPSHFRRILECELTLIGVWQSYDLNYPGNDWRLAIHYLSNNTIDVRDMFYKIDRMENANQVFEEFRIPGKVLGKIALTFNEI